LAGVAGGLNDVVFQDGSAAEGAQHADRQHGDGNGSRDRQSGAQADVDGDGAEENAEDAAEKNGAEGKFRARIIRLHIWLKFCGRCSVAGRGMRIGGWVGWSGSAGQR